MTLLLRGAPISARLRTVIETSLADLLARDGPRPVLATILVGGHAAAEAYRDAIERTFRRVSIDHLPITLPDHTSAAGLSDRLHRLNADRDITGVLVLMPLPSHLSSHVVLETLSPLKDVDGITPTNAGRLHLGLPSLRPSTPQGGVEILDHYGIALPGKHAVVVGRSNVVGRPLATMLTHRHATVTLCHRQSKGLATYTRRADIIALATGVPGLLHGDMAPAGVTVLDFGISVIDGRLVGDADGPSLDHVAALTPVPGGIGPVTTLVLARNTIAAGFAALSGTLDHVDLVVPHLEVPYDDPNPLNATTSPSSHPHPPKPTIAS